MIPKSSVFYLFSDDLKLILDIGVRYHLYNSNQKLFPLNLFHCYLTSNISNFGVIEPVFFSLMAIPPYVRNKILGILDKQNI